MGPTSQEESTCCLCLPLKFGVGLVAMLVLIQSIVSILALFTGDIRFQPNGYSMVTYRLPSIFGAWGIIFGFVGLLGAYDDRLLWTWAFNRFLALKLLTMVVAMMFDRWELSKCDSWLESEEYRQSVKFGKLGINYVDGNPAMTALAEEHVCPWARWAYMLGFALDFAVWSYFFYKCFLFERLLRCWTAYPIDFSKAGDAEARWRLYAVQDPRADELQTRSAKLARRLPPEESNYGAMADTQEPRQGALSRAAEPGEAVPPPTRGASTAATRGAVAGGRSPHAFVSAGALSEPVGPPARVGPER